MKNLRIFQFGIVVLLCGILSLPLSAQTEVMAWSNITGVRVDGELIDFESSLRVGTLKGDMEITGKEKQVRPVFHREEYAGSDGYSARCKVPSESDR